MSTATDEKGTAMIYEIAQLPVQADKTEAFRHAFDAVLPLLTRAPGYLGHLLAQGIEQPDVFHLIVRWRSLEDHTPRFEASDDHQLFMAGLQDYFSQEPKVHHIKGGAFPTGEQPL